MTTDLSLQHPKMVSPIGTDLVLTLFKSKEGIENLGVVSYETIASFRELADHFQVEDNSDKLGEAFKKQRDVDQPRVSGIKKYWNNSKGAVFPNMTIFTNDLQVHETVTVGGREMVIASLKAHFDRFVCDGQCRTTFIKWLLAQDCSEAFFDNTIAIKLLVTNTRSLSDPFAEKIIKQTFSDFHVNLKKPNKSISKHFDSCSLHSRFLNELLEVETAGGTVKSRIALHGKIRKGHVWTFDQFTGLVQKFLKLTSSTAQKHLEKDENYNASISLCRDFLKAIFAVLPLNILDSEDYIDKHDNAIFTKAIFASALGYIGRSIFDEMLLDENLTWDVLSQISLPIESKTDKYWQKAQVTMNDDGAIKIIRGTDRRIGALVCRQLRVYPCAELSA